MHIRHIVLLVVTLALAGASFMAWPIIHKKYSTWTEHAAPEEPFDPLDQIHLYLWAQQELAISLAQSKIFAAGHFGRNNTDQVPIDADTWFAEIADGSLPEPLIKAEQVIEHVLPYLAEEDDLVDPNWSQEMLLYEEASKKFATALAALAAQNTDSLHDDESDAFDSYIAFLASQRIRFIQGLPLSGEERRPLQEAAEFFDLWLQNYATRNALIAFHFNRRIPFDRPTVERLESLLDNTINAWESSTSEHILRILAKPRARYEGAKVDEWPRPFMGQRFVLDAIIQPLHENPDLLASWPSMPIPYFPNYNTDTLNKAGANWSDFAAKTIRADIHMYAVSLTSSITKPMNDYLANQKKKWFNWDFSEVWWHITLGLTVLWLVAFIWRYRIEELIKARLGRA